MERARPQPGVALALLFFFALALLSVTVGAFAQLGGVGSGLIFTEVFVFLGPSILLAHKLGLPARALLRTGPVPARLVILGALIGVANYPVAMTLEGVMHQAMPALAERFDVGNVLTYPTGWTRATLIIGIGLFAPLGEELAFRGAIQRVLRPSLSDAGTIALTAILFAAIHFDPVGALGRIELGALFGAMALWSGSVWVGMAAHAANNLTAMALFYGVGGRSDEEPSAAQLLALLAVGAALTAPLLHRMHRWTQGCESPRELPDLEVHPLSRQVALWLGVMAASFAALVAVDFRGWRLNVIDATTPYRQGLAKGLKHPELDQHLRDLHERAARREVDLSVYERFRGQLFEAAQRHQDDRKLDPAEIEQLLSALR